MRFSWIILVLGVLGPMVVLAADWFTAVPIGETGTRHHHLRWYSPLPLLVWLLAMGLAVYPGLPE